MPNTQNARTYLLVTLLPEDPKPTPPKALWISQEAEKSPQHVFQIAVGINKQLLLTLKPTYHRSTFLAISECTGGTKEGVSFACEL